MSIVPYRFKNHYRQVIAVDERAFADLADLIPPYPRTWWRKVKGFVYIEDDVVRGYAVYTYKNNGPCKDESKIVYYIELVGVDPEFQGQGIGTALVQAILEIAYEDSAVCVAELLVETKKTQNIQFYKRMAL